MTRRPLIPWIVLVSALLLTAGATWTVADSARARDEERFANAVQSTRDRIEARLGTYVTLLRGGVGLFAASDDPVEYADFREYTSRLQVRQRYPGIQGVGFSRRFTEGERDSLIAAVRADGRPDFRVWPDAEGPERHAIVYLEPLDRRNRAAIGYDMSTEPARRAAMARARDTGMPAMSGRVTLVQEIDERKQAGFLIYTPVYRRGVVPTTVAERRAALEGFVYAPFRADDLFAGIFGTEARPRVAFRIYDGFRADPENLLHDSQTNGIAPSDRPLFADRTTVEIAGRMWTIQFATTPSFAAGSRRSLVPAIAVAGLMLSLLLFGMSRSQLRAEEGARKSERRLRSILESLPVGVFVAERGGQITFANSASRRIWGGGDHVDLQRYGEYKGWWTNSGRRLGSDEWGLARALRGERAEGEVVDIEAFDGTRKTILNSAFPVWDPGGKVEMAVAALVDITEQRRAEAALLDREREFRTMVDSIPQLAWMADESGYVFWYNQRWYEYTGTTLKDVAGWKWTGVHHPDHVDRVVERFQRAIEAGAYWEDTFPLRGRDGTFRWFLAQGVPIRDDEERVIHWFGTHTDITAQLEAREAEARAIREQAAREAAEAREKQLRLHAVELERSNRELQDFAYVASHDLQEPLRKISSFCDLLLTEQGERLDEQGKFYVDRMQQASIRMSSLIRDLLAFSRVTTKGQPFEEVDLGDVLTDVIADLYVRVKETGGQVETTSLPTIMADPMQMRQLFQNLVGNALKFHRPGVPPVVEVRGAVEELENPFGSGRQRVCRIVVEDNGVGFDEKYVDRMFAPFQRLHTQAEFEGTGIGLAICRRIVERHGGTITARSTPDEGSAFIVTLPLT